MANVSITIPDSLVPRLVASARAMFPEHAALTDVQTFKAITANYWRTILDSYEQGLASSSAAKAAHDKAVTDSAGIG